MKKIIQQKLKEIELKENIKIILAVESGSRAWGFESSDSDYDVRFVYIRSKEDYLKLDGIRDVVEWQLDETLDINGWDIQKALRLLYKSNPTLFEWCSSPIVYRESEEANQLRQLLPIYFSPKKSLYHYWHMAKTNYQEHLTGETVKAKKYFYVLRPILASTWVLKHQSNPPILFETLVEIELPGELKPVVYDLLEKKKEVKELDLVPRIDTLSEYIEKNLLEMEERAKEMATTQTEWTDLNQFFLSLL